MIIDSYCKFSDSQAPTTNTTTYSDYSYDCGNVTPKNEIGAGEPLAVVISVIVAATVSTDTFDFAVVSSTSGTTLSTNAKEVVARTIAGASLTAGSTHVLPIPPGAVDQRYIGVRYTLGDGDGITVDADLLPLSMIPKRTIYADGVTWEA